MPAALPALTDTAPTCCPPIGSGPMLSRDEAGQLALRLKAVADPTRLQLVTALLAAPNGTACTCDLAPAVGLSEGTISHHLKKLETVGLVSKERRGLNVHYRVESVALHAIARALNAGCC